MKKIMKKVAAMRSMTAKSTRHEKCEAAAKAMAVAMDSMNAEAAALKSMVMKLDENLLVLRDAVATLQDAVTVLQDAVIVLQVRRMSQFVPRAHRFS